MSTLKPREAEVVIYQGDDLPRLAELNQAVKVAERGLTGARQAAEDAKGAPSRVGDELPSILDAERAVEDARREYAEFVEEAAERALVVKVRAIGRRRFRSLLEAHPAREVEVTKTDNAGNEQKVTETHPDDVMFDVNVETFSEALLKFVDTDDDSIRTIVEPDLTPAKLRAFVEDELSEGDFEDLWPVAYFLNRNPGADPKAPISSTGSPRLTET